MILREGLVTVEDLDGFVRTLDAIATEHETTIQAFDATYITGASHLERALTLADRAFERDENIARDRAVELLLYAAGRRQIDQALTIGLSTGTTPAVLLVDGGDETSAADELDALLDPAQTLGAFDVDRVCSFYEISPEERAASEQSLAALVEERVALLAIEK